MTDNIPGLTHNYATLGEVTLHYVTAGKGEAVVLLHGYPQTWYEWRFVIPALARRYLVVAPDLRGLGDSSRPLAGYDKKTVADDIWRLLHEHLNTANFYLAGHDWGGVVAYSLARAHPKAISSMAIIDVPIPGENTHGFATSHGRWHHAFHWVPDLPEALTFGRERIYLEHFYRNFGARQDVIDEEAVSEYLRTYRQPGAMRAGFNYYRAFHQDVADNLEALSRYGKLEVPVLMLAGSKGRGRGADLMEESARPMD